MIVCLFMGLIRSSRDMISSSDGYISFVVFEENELGIAFKPEEINWDDDKFKKQYQLYFDVDIKKNVMSTQNIITDIKIKKKKNVNNNIEQEKNIEENREENTEKIKEEKMEVDNP